MKVRPPKYAQRNARKAIECINQGSKAMTEVGLSRAYQLAKGEALTMKDLIEINKFRRHQKNASYKGNPCKDNGYVAWTAWGYSVKKKKGVTDFGDWSKRQLSKYEK